MADGGEGTVEALVLSTEGRLREVNVRGPLGEELKAAYGQITGKTAVIEMASAAGLSLVPDGKRNPLHTTTYGLGQMIIDGLDQGCRDFVIGIGGSATNDCGCGMAQAMGVRFFDSSGSEITEAMTGELMGKVASVDMSCCDERIKDATFVVACDVTNPLLGPNGASHTYGPQKGADDESVEILEKNMRYIIELIENESGRKVRGTAGAGAAGGLGAGLLAFCDARLEPGIDIIMRYNRFVERIESADLIITGEGRIDATTASGKTISGIARAAEGKSIPVIVLAGSIGPGAQEVLNIGVTVMMPICTGPMTEAEAMAGAEKLLADTAEQAMRLVMLDCSAKKD